MIDIGLIAVFMIGFEFISITLKLVRIPKLKCKKVCEKLYGHIFSFTSTMHQVDFEYLYKIEKFKELLTDFFR